MVAVHLWVLVGGTMLSLCGMRPYQRTAQALRWCSLEEYAALLQSCLELQAPWESSGRGEGVRGLRDWDGQDGLSPAEIYGKDTH